MDETPKDAWDRLREAIRGGVLPDHNGDLLPKNVEQTDRIILLELARETAIADGMGLDPLRPYHDFAQWSGDRRPDPTPGQWQWLYRNIGVRHPFLSVDKVVGMMAGRDALLPFLRSAPDLRFVVSYEKFFEEEPATDSTDSVELPYAQLEDAIKNDAPAKLAIFRVMSRNVTAEQLLARAVALEKPAVVCSLLKTQPSEQCVPALTRILRHWTKPEELLSLAVKAFGPELAAWHDEYGNGFFWYLYACSRPVSKAMVAALSDEIIATWETPNRYGIVPSDLWAYYRTGPSLSD